MNNLNTIKELFTYEDDELFYKEYYEAKKKNKIPQFLTRYDADEIKKRKLIVREIKNGWNPVAMDDEMLFSSDANNDIVVSKHFRYTPTFMHKHTFFEIIYVMNGHCRQVINNHEVDLKEGQFCIIAPLTTHSISVFDDSILINILVKRKTFENVFYTLLQKSNKITSFINQSLYLYQAAGYLLADTNKDEEILDHVLNLYHQYESKKPHYDLVMNTELMYVLSLLLQRYEDTIELPQTPYGGNKDIIDIVSYIEDHFKDITLQKTADHFKYSTSYLSRLIKKETGESFRDIVNNIKFDRARGMLETTEYSIEEIAYAVGFENSENFYRLFKKKFHITPGNYRKRSKSQ